MEYVSASVFAYKEICKNLVNNAAHQGRHLPL